MLFTVNQLSPNFTHIADAAMLYCNDLMRFIQYRFKEYLVTINTFQPYNQGIANHVLTLFANQQFIDTRCH